MALIETRKNANDTDYVSAIVCSDDEVEEILVQWQELHPTWFTAIVGADTPAEPITPEEV